MLRVLLLIMAIVPIQQKIEQSTTAVASFTTTAMTVGAGNAIVACMSGSAVGITTLTASDSKTDAYVPSVSRTSTSNGLIAIAAAINVVGGSTTFTVTPNVSGFCSIAAQEYSGVGPSAAAEATNNGGATSTAVNPGAVNPATPNSLYVAAWLYDGGITNTFTYNVSGEGWNARANLNSSANEPLGSQDLVASGSKTGSATLVSTSSVWAACVATFKPASSARSFEAHRPAPFAPSAPTLQGF